MVVGHIAAPKDPLQAFMAQTLQTYQHSFCTVGAFNPQFNTWECRMELDDAQNVHIGTANLLVDSPQLAEYMEKLEQQEAQEQQQMMDEQ